MHRSAPAMTRTGQTFLLLRWVLAISTAYLVVFSSSGHTVRPGIALFVAAYLGSNLLLPALLARAPLRRHLDVGIVLFDTIAVVVGLTLAGRGADFFPVYFLVVFLAAMTQRLHVIVGAAALVSIVHVSAVAQFRGLSSVLSEGYLLRIPFLFTVALFLGHQVSLARRQERVAAAQARKLRRTELLSAVTHDLKSPVGAIQSLAEVMLRGAVGPLTNDQANLTRRILVSARHATDLAVNLLDAARIDSGVLNLHRTAANLADIVISAVERARTASELKGIRLQFACPLRPPRVHLDVLQMERVVANLLDNAVKYTPEGGSVTVSLWSLPGELVLAVRDNGPGIPADELPGIFVKYRRREGTSGIEGSGLGLFIVKALVDAHCGSVHAASGVGMGTTITIRVPTTSPDPIRAPSSSTLVARRAWFRLSLGAET